jgi:hypothetical protein
VNGVNVLELVVRFAHMTFVVFAVVGRMSFRMSTMTAAVTTSALAVCYRGSNQKNHHHG